MATLVSGGALGADSLFESLAGNSSKIILKADNIKSLNKETVTLLDNYLHNINNKYLNRSYPTKNEYVNNLLRRDLLVSSECNIVFAISWFESNQVVHGGTAWAFYCFIEKC